MLRARSCPIKNSSIVCSSVVRVGSRQVTASAEDTPFEERRFRAKVGQCV
jgi:hypothetical protein